MQEAQETGVWFLGGEDPLEEGMATHSSILAWRIPWIEELGGLQSVGSQSVGRGWSDWERTHTNNCLKQLLNHKLYKCVSYLGKEANFLDFKIFSQNKRRHICSVQN